jgi:hypothetical protein
VNFATSKNLIAKCTTSRHSSIHKYTRPSPDGKTKNQIDHFLIDRQRHSGVFDVRSFRAADCNTEHYLVVAKFEERLAVNKKISHRFHMERFNLKKLNEVDRKEKFRVCSFAVMQLWNILTLRWKLRVLGKRLERMSKFKPKRV